MDLDLTPQAASVTLVENDGGAYYTWSDSSPPGLGLAKLGAGKLVLKPRGFALPHYADCFKIGFVSQGSCRVGVVLPNTTTEHVLTIKKGDVLPVHRGAVTWWYNGENSVAEVMFLGETSKAYTPAQFNYYFLSGAMGVLGGFSSALISQVFDLNKTESENLVKSQTGAVIIKLAEGQKLPEPSNETSKKIAAYNIEAAKSWIHVNRGGSLTIADSESVDSLKEFGLSAALLNLKANSILGPIASADTSSQLFYVLEGSGRVQISGLAGKNALDAKLQRGDLFVVPAFFGAALLANPEEGLQCISIFTSSKPSFVKFAGQRSVWEALSSSTLEAGLNVDVDLVKLFKSKI